MSLGLKTFAVSVGGLAVFGLLLFLPAGTFLYWQAWLFLAVFAAVSTWPTIYWARKMPEVLQRRMNAGPTKETRPVQKILIVGFQLWFAAILVVSGLDHRFGWSEVPLPVVLVGDLLVAVGLGGAMWVVHLNNYASSNITVEADQHLVSNGLYGLVRHPMYSASLVLSIGVPLALGSYWTLLLLIPGSAIFAARILDEEKLLREELPGYPEYAGRVRHRLVPYIW
nr:isoprenylcysteine carboxylmethyltransferase family protein [Mycolicibacterium komanii]CRL68977.1 putative integral membrane protein [Mycolicibacterium komanii]